MLVYDENRYYCWRDIERERHRLLASDEQIETIDYGTGGNETGEKVIRKVRDIARGHLERREVGELLFRLTSYLGHKQERPLRIVELGTSLGVTTAYLASASSANRVVTLEGSGAVAEVARQQWKALRLENVECVEGRIEDSLYKHARAEIDLAYVDANHTYEATLRYADYLLPRLTEKGVLVVDDIHYSREMACAWEALKADKRVTSSMDLYHVGLLFVDPHYLKRHYKIHI